MDIENLRELIAAFETLGSEAKEAFVWYLVLEYVPGFLLGAGWLGIAAFVVYQAGQIVRSLMPSKRLMDAFGVVAFWSPPELEQACEILRNNKKKT